MCECVRVCGSVDVYLITKCASVCECVLVCVGVRERLK